MKTGIIQDPIFLEHLRGVGHIESPRRLEVIYDLLNTEFSGSLLHLPPRAAPVEELAAIHTPDHISRVADTAGRRQVALDPDTQTTARSYEAAVRAAGGFPV